MRTAVAARPVLAAGAAVVVIAGAYAADLLSHYMMSAVALVGAWLMLTLLLSYMAVRFRPSVGVPVIAGFAVGAVIVAIVGGGAMMMGG